MRIGFDVSQTGRLKAGCGYFADCLIRQLAEADAANEYILYPTFGDLFWDPRWRRNTCQVNRTNFRRAEGHNTITAAQRFWRDPPSALDKELGNPDIVHANNFFCPVGLKTARLVYTLYDLSFLVRPDWTTEDNRIGCFTGTLNASLYADFIIAISEHSRRHFLDVFPHYPAQRIATIYPASRFSGRSCVNTPGRLRPLQGDRFWLSVGTLEPRKNHARLLRAYARLKAAQAHVLPLVLAGGPGWLVNELEALLDDLGIRQGVIMLGYADDTELLWLYQNCFAFIYPSLYEGFGLPVLEAMSQGAPVITSDATAIPEVIGPAGILIDPSREESIFRAMLEIASHEGLRLSLKGSALERSTHFSWRGAAQGVLNIYREVVREPSLADWARAGAPT